MYYATAVALLLFVLPALSVAAEMLWNPDAPPLTALSGKWFTFWGVGVRLFLAGLMQTFRPKFTAQSIFDIGDPASLVVVREVGFGNLAMGMLGLLSLAIPEWRVPAALAGGLYYCLAGVGHAMRKVRNVKEQFALLSDFAIFFVLAAFVVWSLV